MSMNNMGVGITIRGKDEASGAVRKAEGSFSGLFNTIKKGWQNAALVLGAVGYKAVKTGDFIRDSLKTAAASSATFERSLKFVQARTGATSDEMQKYRDQLLGKEFEGRNVDTAAAVFQRLAEETGNASESMLMLKSAMNLARVANLEETEAAGMLRDVMGEFQIGADKSTMVTDKMTWAMKEFGLVGNELRPMLFGVAAGSQLAKASFDDTLLTLGMMKDVIPNASRAAMAANMAMVQLANPDVRKELQKQGVAVVDQQGKTRALVDIIGDLAEATKGMTEADRAKNLASIFSARSSGGLSIIIDKLTKGVTTAEGATLKGAEAIRYYKEQMNAAGGETARAAKIITNDYAGALKRAENAQKRFTQSIGAVMAELRRPFVEAGAKAINSIVDAFRGMSPGTQKLVIGFATAFGTIASVLGKMLIAGAAMKMFGLTIKDVVISLASFGLIIGPLTILLGGMAVGLYTLYRATQKNAGGIGDSVAELGRKVKLGWSAVVDIFSNGKLSDAMRKELSGAENSGVLKFANMIERLRVRLGAFFEGFSKGFARALDELGPQAREMLGQFQWLIDIINGEAFKDPLGNWVKSGDEAGFAMKDFALTAMQFLKGVGDKITEIVDGLTRITGDDIKGALIGMRDTFNDVVAVLRDAGSVLGVFVDLLKIVEGIFGAAGGAISQFVNVLSLITGQQTYDEFSRDTDINDAYTSKKVSQIGTAFSSMTQDPEELDTMRKRGRELRDIMETKYGEENTVGNNTYSWGKTKEGKINSESIEAYQRNLKELQAINKNLQAIGQRPIIAMVDGQVLAEVNARNETNEKERNLEPVPGIGNY